MRRQLKHVGVILGLLLGGCGDSQKGGISSRGDGEPTERVVGCTTPSRQSDVPAQTKPDALVPTYEVVGRDVYDAPIKTQIKLSAVVSGAVTEFDLRQLLQKLYDEANATHGFKYHGGKPTHVAIYIYTSRRHFESGMGQWIAMLTKLGEGAQINIQMKTELIAQGGAQPEVKYGLTEAKRQEVFRAVVMAQDRAELDADRISPMPDPSKPGYSQAKAKEQIEKWSQVQEALRVKYESEVAKRYGITQEQLREIRVEGHVKNWPIPPRS